MKKIFILACFIICAFSLFAAEFVKDEASILTSNEVSLLNEKCGELSQKYDCGIYLVTVKDFEQDFETKYYSTDEASLARYTIEDYSFDYFMKNNFGFSAEKNGLMLILSMADRDFDIMAYGNFGNKAFTDYGKDALEDSFIKYFGANNWYKGFDAYLKKVSYELKWAQKGFPYDYRSLSTRLEVIPKAFLIALVISMILSLIITKSKQRGLNNISSAVRADSYVVSENIAFTSKLDNFIRTSETRTHISQQNNSGGAGGSRGGTTVHSNGSSHHSGKF